MSNQIHQLPDNHYDFGTAFDYDLWTRNTRVDLTKVNWDSGYRDVVDFGSVEKRDAFFNTVTTTTLYTSTTYRIKPNNPRIRLDIPYNAALRFNYLVVTQGAAPMSGHDGRKFFYFVHEVNYIAENTTELVIQLDAWQSYFYDVKLLSGYVVKGHLGVKIAANSYNHPIYDIPESIDLGGDYTTDKVVWHEEEIFSASSPIMVSSTISLASDPGTTSEPKNPSAKPLSDPGVTTGLETYLIAATDYNYYMQLMSAYPWITNGIVRANLVPTRTPLGKRAASVSTTYPPRNALKQVPLCSRTGAKWEYIDLKGIHSKMSGPDGWGNPEIPKLANIYRKVFAAPYSFIEMYANNGTSVVVNPRTQRNGNMQIAVNTGLVPWAESAMYRVTSDSNYLMNDLALTIRNFPTVPVVNNQAAIAYASQARSIQAARTNAKWGEQRAIMGANNAYNNAEIGANAASNMQQMQADANVQMTDYQNERGFQSAMISGVAQIAGSGASGGMGGGAIGAAAGMVMGAMSAGAGLIGQIHGAATASEVTRMNNATANRAVGISNQAGMAIAGNNQAMAAIGAKGDYAAAINAIDAKVQDLTMTPPSMAGAIGGEMELVANGLNLYFQVRFKSLTVDAKTRVLNMFARYGYATNRFHKFNGLKVMKQFSYWQVLELSMDTSGLHTNEMFANALRGILEKGVTVYTSPEFIGRNDFEGNAVA